MNDLVTGILDARRITVDSTLIVICATCVMFMLLAIGLPVGVVLGLVGLAGLYLTTGAAMTMAQLQTLPYYLAADYAFTVVPMFVLMGTFAMNSGMADEVYSAAEKWLGGVKGGLYITTVGASAAFGAASGSSVVNCSVFTRVALPQMLRLGYSRQFSSGCIAAAGTIAAMIPPSVTMVVYCIMTEVSLGHLMIAGIIPGVMEVLLYILMICIYVRIRPSIAPGKGSSASLRERIQSLRGIWVVIVIFIAVMGGIYTGTFSPSAAGAVGAFVTFLLVLVRRRLSVRAFLASLEETVSITAVVFTIIIGGLIFSRFLVASGFVFTLLQFVGTKSLSPFGLAVFTAVLFGVLGCIVDTISLVVVTMPFLFPLIKEAGMDPIWYGILAVKLVEIGAITPPIGLNLYATVGAAQGQVRIEDVIRGILLFLVVDIVCLVLLFYFPSIAVWLPNTMR